MSELGGAEKRANLEQLRRLLAAAPEVRIAAHATQRRVQFSQATR